MYCSQCGKEIPNDSIFCGNCGSVIGTSQASANGTDPAVNTAQQKGKPVMVSFCAKKQFGQFLVSNVILEIGTQQYRFPFNTTAKIEVPSGLQRITCYMDYLGKSGLAEMLVVLYTGQPYQIVYTTPIIVSSPGNLTIN